MRVILYGKPNCKGCHLAADLLTSLNVRFYTVDCTPVTGYNIPHFDDYPTITITDDDGTHLVTISGYRDNTIREAIANARG